MKQITAIYDVTIEQAAEKYRVTWENKDKNWQEYFINDLPAEAEAFVDLYNDSEYHLKIGNILFDFLDGKKRYFRQALQHADQLGDTLQLNLHIHNSVADLPFELLAKGDEFLLLEKVFLARRVSRRGCRSKNPILNRPLRVLFMSSSPRGIEPELIPDQEEEAILGVTETLPMQLDIEESGTLEGLGKMLMHYYYDVVILSGHGAVVDEEGKPYFRMENIYGCNHRIYPKKLWSNALRNNPPRLLFLSGCRTGQTKISTSFAQMMVEHFKVPTALGWGQKVEDSKAILAVKMILQELSRGFSILQAVQRTRYEIEEAHKGSMSETLPDWPFLRLYCDGTPLTPIVKKEQQFKPQPRRTTHVYLENSGLKVLKEGFVGRRRQMQDSLYALEQDEQKVGALVLGPGGLGKSSLAGKITERFPGVPVIVHQGKLDDFSLGVALNNTFQKTGDSKGQCTLSGKMGMSEKLERLCSGSFKEKNYILLLDGFEQNLEGLDQGRPERLLPTAAGLLYTLLDNLPYALKRTHLIITSRHPFSLTHRCGNLVEKRLHPVWVTSFNGSEILKKTLFLENSMEPKDANLSECLLTGGSGHPLLMERLDRFAGKGITDDPDKWHPEIQKIRDDLINSMGLHDLYKQADDSLRRLLKDLVIYDKWVPEAQIPIIEEKLGISGGIELLKEGMRLSLVEHDSFSNAYQLTPLLREIL